ncbi:hypothetical protein MUN82_20470 [Hymenobacter aerilatus]|uniref:Lipoprotein n=1 Tax=Hymenobacter aerilatus TaxID=2932251 RepID=A0A8T9STX8_9BACT|nr:hypothetical protein [Hymenobacter aerilatus]UOR05295.1 hypothetical protein MUN82_20470 [Hymenobacter aerilatus]
MKRYGILSVAFLLLVSCSKTESDTLIISEGECIEKIAVKQDTHRVSDADYTATTRLFQQNSIPLQGLRIVQYDTETIILNGVSNSYVHIKVAQYSGDLPFFYGEIGYHFKDGKFYYLSGDKLTTTLSPVGKLPLRAVRTLYFKAFATYNQQRNFYKAADFMNKCVDAELGYYPVKTSSTPTKIVRAWHVTPKGKQYPEAYIDDENSETIYFFDGIMSLSK